MKATIHDGIIDLPGVRLAGKPKRKEKTDEESEKEESTKEEDNVKHAVKKIMKAAVKNRVKPFKLREHKKRKGRRRGGGVCNIDEYMSGMCAGQQFYTPYGMMGGGIPLPF